MNSKIAIITGASRGLGRSIALNLAGQGVDIVGTFRSSEDEAGEVMRQIGGQGARGAMLQLDVSKSS